MIADELFSEWIVKYSPRQRKALIDLLLLLDPYCSVCTARHGVYSLHPNDIHLDLETDDFLDDASKWQSHYTVLT